MGSSVCRAAIRSALGSPSATPTGWYPQGISAELIAARRGLSRTELDEFSAASHEKAARAAKDGLFDDGLAPIAGLQTDEIIRPGTTVDTLAGLKPAFLQRGRRRAIPPRVNWESRRVTPRRCPTAAPRC